MARFQPGQSGNPSGKTKGAKDKRTALREMLQPHAKALMDVAVGMAKQGDTAALKLCLDRLMPPIREERIHVTVPKITGPDDCTVAQAAVLNAVANGEMLPSEGSVLSGLIDAQRRAYETTHLAKQLADIQTDLEKIKSKGNL
jgi:hypothetical protein